MSTNTKLAEPVNASAVLRNVLNTLKRENDKPDGCISDTIWYSAYETLFDYVESSLEALAAHDAEQVSQAKPAPAQAVPAGFVLVPVEFIEAGQRVAQEYARTNPKWPMWYNGEAEPKVQDPCGVHAWLEQAAVLASVPAAPAPEAPTLTHELQQQCSDWGVYWRASDAHGVDLSIEQAEELLRRALGVEVAISKAAPQAQAAGQDERAAFGAWFQGFRHGWKSEKDVAFDAWQARAALAQRQTLTLDAFDEHDLCDSFAGLPVEWFNPGPSFGATAGEHS